MAAHPRRSRSGSGAGGQPRATSRAETKFERAERLRDELERFEDLPNAGASVAGDLRLLGFSHPRDLRGADPRAMYERLQALTGSRQDPCVLDVFLALVDFVEGAPARPWWDYTPERLRLLSE